MIEKFGRKSMLIVSQVIIVSSLGLVVLTDWIGWPDFLGVVGVAIFIFGFCIGNGPITWIYMSDILPDVGVALVSGVLWLVATGVGILFPLMKDSWSLVTAFDVFLAASTVGLVFDIFLV